MDVNIALTTDVEIQEIISKFIERGYNQWDEAWVETLTPFEVNPDGKEPKKTGFCLYPELLSYYDGKAWITVPWICFRVEIQNHHTIDEKFHIDFVKWMKDELEAVGYRPFKDEDAFAGYASKEDRDGYTRLKLYINPSFPNGYWSNHTL